MTAAMQKPDGFMVIRAMMQLTGQKRSTDLAKAMGYSRQEISRVRCNHVPVRRTMILKMLEITDLPYSELMQKLGLA